MNRSDREHQYISLMGYMEPTISVKDLRKLGFFDAPASTKYHSAYETDTKLWNYYGKAIEKYPNVLFTHTADMMSSKILGV